MAKVLLLVVLLSSVVFSKVFSTSNETNSCSLQKSRVFQYFQELMLSQNLITVTDGIRMKRKSLEKLFRVSEDDAKECGGSLWTMRQIEGNIDKIMNNFVLEFDLSKVIVKEPNGGVEPRRRRHHQTLPMMMMGIVIFLMVFVPMGFNFLGVVGGKAFLMAKLALLLASVNGLRRVASSGVSYGLYQPIPEHHPSYGPQSYYDRFDRPRESSA